MNSENLVIGRFDACLQDFGYSEFFFFFFSLQNMIISGRTDVCIW